MSEPAEAEVAPRRGGILRAGGIIASMTLVSRILGLVRDVVIAHYFGARPEADAFFVAFKIPNLFRRLFAEGAFSQGFVPVLAEYRAQRDPEAVRQLVARVVAGLGGVLLVLTLAGMLAAPAVIAVFAPGFEVGEPRRELAVQMLRLTFPYLFFISLTALTSGVLNTYDRFAIPAVTPVWLNLSLIAAALWLAPRLDEPVLALAWGVLLAGILQLGFQLPAVAKLGLLSRPRSPWRDDGVRRIGRLMLPAMFGASVGQLNLMLDTLLASFLVAGSISWLYYADRLMELPLGVFAIALGTVLLPTLARTHSEGDAARFSATVDRGLRLGLLLVVPAAAALVVLADALVTTLFHYGAMSAGDVRMAALALQAYALGLIGFTGVKILAPAYFARQDTRTPVRIALIAMGVNLTLNLALIGPLAHIGLALATTCAALVNAGLLLRGLLREGVWRAEPGWWRFTAQLSAATGVMIGLLWWASPAPAVWLQADLLPRIGMMALCVGGGASVFFGALALGGLPPRRLLAQLGRA